MDIKKLLDEWWNTEPFGFDNPDTYSGILSLLEKVEAERDGLREVLRQIKILLPGTPTHNNDIEWLINKALQQGESDG